MKKINLILTFIVLTACSHKKNTISLPQESKVLEKKTVEPKNGTPVESELKNNNIQNQISPVIIGNVITENQSSLAFLNSGTLENIYVKAGDHVKKGQILASLVDTEEVVQMQSAEIKLKQKQLAADLEKKKLDRITEQFKAGILNKATLETESNAFDSIALDVEENKNDLEGKKYNLKMTKIIAPYEGVISQKNKSIGDFVSAGTTVFQITQNKNMEIYAQIPSIYFDKLKPGMSFSIVSSTNKIDVGQIQIRKIIPVLDKNSRTFDLYGKIISFKGTLNPGDFVEIKL